MTRNKISVNSTGLSSATKNGAFRVLRDRLEDLAGRPDLPVSEFLGVYNNHQADLEREADVLRRHGRADPTGVVTLRRVGARTVFGRIGGR